MLGGGTLVEAGDNSGIAPYSRYLVRPHAGALGPLLTYPPRIGNTLGARPLVNVSASGEVLVDDTGASRGNAFGPLSGALASTTPTSVGGVSAVAEVPSGNAAGIFQVFEGAPYVAFRAPGGSFDFAKKITLPLASKDKYGLPVGIALDPDGGTVAVYASYPSGAMLQTFPPAGGEFGTPTQIDTPGAGSGGGGSMAWSRDGHAVVAWFDKNEFKVVYAATRAPGQPFGKAAVVADNSTGDGFNGGPYVAVSDAGTSLVGYTRKGTASCGNGSVAEAATSTGNGWTINAPAGPNSYLTMVGAGGDRLAAVVRVQIGCPSESLMLYSGTGAAVSGDGNLLLGTPAFFGAIGVGPSGDMLVGYGLGETQQLRAFEEPGGATPGTPGGAGTPGPIGLASGPTGPTTGTTPLAFRPPVSIKLTGPIIVIARRPPSLSYTCLVEGAYPLLVCKIQIQVTVSSAAIARAKVTKPIVFATGSGTIPAGKTGKIALKLTKAGLGRLFKKGKLTAAVVATVTRGPTVTKLTSRVVFKAAKHRR